MRKIIYVLLISVLISIDAGASVDRRGEWEPLDGITHLVSWLKKLNRNFDEYVEKEKTQQLLRSVDHLRKGLYDLETDSNRLLDCITDQNPSQAEQSQIRDFVGKLLRTVRGLGDNVSSIGGDLRMSDPEEGYAVEDKLTHGLHTRGTVLTYVQKELMRFKLGGTWSPEPIRERLREGLQAVKEAQIATTEFQRKLEGLTQTK